MSAVVLFACLFLAFVSVGCVLCSSSVPAVSLCTGVGRTATQQRNQCQAVTDCSAGETKTVLTDADVYTCVTLCALATATANQLLLLLHPSCVLGQCVSHLTPSWFGI